MDTAWTGLLWSVPVRARALNRPDFRASHDAEWTLTPRPSGPCVPPRGSGEFPPRGGAHTQWPQDTARLWSGSGADFVWPQVAAQGLFRHLSLTGSPKPLFLTRRSEATQWPGQDPGGCHPVSRPLVPTPSSSSVCSRPAGVVRGPWVGLGRPTTQAPVGQAFLALGHTPVPTCGATGSRLHDRQHHSLGICCSSSLGAPRPCPI